MNASARPALSIVLATIEPWPDLARCLRALVPQVEALGGEIIVGDGHGGALDAATAASENVKWIRRPGASVFALRALAIEQASGEIIATTEDHCVVAGDWCAQILRALDQAPDAMAVSGPVLNGSTERLMDWANYLHTFGCLLPPISGEQRERCPPNANVAYRRAVIPTGPLEPGWVELQLNPRLFAEGRFLITDRLSVTHVQSHGLFGTLRAHFDNGRTTTGLHRVPLSRRQFPWHQFRGTVRVIGGPPELRPVVRRCLPLLFLLSCCHSLGEVVGILAGPGQSPARVR